MTQPKVTLISLTQPVVEGVSTAEELVVYTARVSNPGNQMNMATAPKLIKYLLDNAHYSPFEQVSFGVEIVTSRAIATQILRHWAFSFSEWSQRYAKSAAYVEYPARRQDTKNRQNSVDDMDESDKAWFSEAQKQVWDTSFHLYERALDRGVAKEQARFLLPLNTQTTLYMTGNLRDWIFYLKLRSANGTQTEHADIAKAIIRDIVVPRFPNVAIALGWKND